MTLLKHAVAAASLAFVLSGAAARGAAEDWPKWMGPRGDNISTETITDAAWPEGGPKELWKKEVGGGHASPVAAAGKIYVFSLVDRTSEVLTALDAKTGAELWKQGYDRSKMNGGGGLKNAEWDGTRATPTIDGDAIYTLGSAGELTRRALADGKQAWQLNVLKETGAENLEWGCSSSPLIVGDLLYVQTGIGEGVPIAIAVDKNTGKIVWKSAAKGGPEEGGKKAFGAGYAHIILADVGGAKQLIVFGGRAAYGMNPADGKHLWSTPWSTDYDVNAATPVYREGKVLISSEYSTAKGILYTVSGSGVTKVWESGDIKAKYQPPIVEDGYIYVNSRGNIACVKWDDGKTMWEAKDRGLRIGPGGSIVRLKGDKLLAMSERGKLSLATATPQGIKAIGKPVDLIEAPNVWASPLVYDGKIFVKGGNELIVLDVSGK